MCFVVIKIHEKNKNKKIDNFSISIDVPINKDPKKLKKRLNKFIYENNLEINLSKDAILERLNNKTKEKNNIFKKQNAKYIYKNNSSNLIERLKL